MIQKGLLLGLSVVCLGAFVPLIAHAQDTGTIKVIRDDGAIQSIEIPSAPSVAEEVVVSPAPKTEPKVMSAEDLMKQMEEAIPAEAVSVPEVKPEPEETKPVVTKKDAPKAKKKKVIAKKKTTKSKAVAKSSVHQYMPSSTPPPLPNIKPPKPTYVAQPSRITDYTDLPSNTYIDRDVALRVALEYAPPARSFTVHDNRQYKDRIVYQVTFKTEDGPHDILVDAETGDVLKK